MASILDQLTKDEFTEMMDNVNASQLRVLLEAERKKNAELMAQIDEFVKDAYLAGMMEEIHNPSTTHNRLEKVENYIIKENKQ
jgi:hypothetical protein